MKKQIENIKKQWKKESGKIGMVILGFASGTAIAKGMRMLAEKYPEHEDLINYSTAPLLGASGWLICNASDADAVLVKHFGYGLTASAALEGIKIIPVVSDVLKGVEDNFRLKKTYFTEDSPLEIGNFGMNSLPIKSVELGEIPKIEVDLPELEASSLGYNGEQTRTDNLGYNGDQTRDADNMKGIL